jgi:hypothetical protein
MAEREAKSSVPQFLVDYSLSGSMPVRASTKEVASEQAFATLHDLIGQAELLGVTVRLANQVQLGHAEIAIDWVQAVPPNQEIVEASPTELFRIISLSRDDLVACGFDPSQVTDADMEKLASKMADQYVKQLFWLSLRFMAGELGIPNLPDKGTVSRNLEAVSTVEEATPQQEFFDIYASISREELEFAGFDTHQVTDEDMTRLARRMTDDYMEQLYSTSLRIMAEAVGIPKRPS